MKTILYENEPLLNGIKITLYKIGNVATLSIKAGATEEISIGQKDAYLELPKGFRPSVELTELCFSQTGKKFIVRIATSGKVGIYYVLDAISSNDNVYGNISWAIDSTK